MRKALEKDVRSHRGRNILFGNPSRKVATSLMELEEWKHLEGIPKKMKKNMDPGEVRSS